MKTILYGGMVMTPEGSFPGGVVLENGRIARLLTPDSALPDGERVDCAGRYIAPGFVDVHVHACYGGNVMDATPQALRTLTRLSAAHGTTALLPTTLSAPHEAVKAAIENIGRAMQAPAEGARILGVHLEGNYFAREMAGAQNPAYLYPPSADDYMDLVQAGPVRRVAAAPELSGALDMGRRLSAMGVQMSIGHSNGRCADVALAVKAGYTSLTHIYNAQSTISSIFLYPDAGVCEGALLYDEIRVECICDGHHLSPDLLRLIHKVKGPQGMLAVTDSVYAGAPDGDHEMGGLPVTVANNLCCLRDGSAMAGSVATMDLCARTLYRGAGLPLCDVVQICSGTPAALIGEDDHMGAIRVGYDADVIVFDEDINVTHTYVQGRPVHIA